MTIWTDERAGSRVAAILLLAGLAAAGGAAWTGCAGPERSEPALADSAYVSVMARLTVIREATRPGPRSMPDSLVRRSVDSVLAGAGVDRERLVEFARLVGDEPERMAALWERIRTGADSLREAGWEPPGPVTSEVRPGQP